MSDEKFWLNAVLDEVEANYPDGKIVVSSGISPSASYHIGHFREFLSADLVYWGLKDRGREAEHVHVVDNFDPLRKRYDFLPEDYEQYVGWPVCLVPDPEGCHNSYADHFFNEFYQHIQRLNLEVKVVKSYEDLYSTGKMAPQIEKAVDKVDVIKRIFKEVSNRDLPDDWMPLQILSDNKSFNEWRYRDIDTESKEIVYQDQAGETGRVKYDNGRVKLNWRLDWPARWQVLGVMVEPHGFQEHGARGGSYETGLLLAKEVYGIEGPLAAIQYGHVHLKGDQIKMSSSKGNLITPDEAFAIMPPTMLRYFYARYPGKKRIDFDPGLGFFNMMDEFMEAKAAVEEGEEHEYSSAYRYAVYNQNHQKVANIPFSHMVSVAQTADFDLDKVIEILNRSEYSDQTDDRDAVNQLMQYVKVWLEKYAPERMKFSLLKKLPDTELSQEQKDMLAKLADRIEASEENDAQWFHEAIHETREEAGLDPKTAFKSIYQVLIGKDFGPKAGWYLSMLDRDWLVSRLRLKS